MQMHSFASGSNGKCSSKEPSAFALRCWATPSRAVRPLAASAPIAHIEPTVGCAGSNTACLSTVQEVEAPLKQSRFIEPSSQLVSKPVCLSSATRVRARQSNAGRAATSFARGGGAQAFASGATQRNVKALVVCPRPNPSIEATNNGVKRLRVFAKAVPPLFAPHLQR